MMMRISMILMVSNPPLPRSQLICRQLPPDVLDQFTPPPSKGPASPPSASISASIGTKPVPFSSASGSSAPPPTATIPPSAFPTDSDDVDPDIDSEFTRELQRGMESLMREMGGLGATDGNILDGAAGIGGGAGEGGAGKKTEKELEQERAFRAAW